MQGSFLFKVCSTEFVGICEILVNWMICVSGRPTWAPLQKKSAVFMGQRFFYDDYKLHENRMIEGIGVCHKASRGDPWGARYAQRVSRSVVVSLSL